MAKRSLKKKKEEEPLICKSIQYELAIFFLHYPPKVFNRNLRDLIMDYLTSHPDPGYYGMEAGMEAIWKLMRVLDKAADELNPRDFNEIFAIAEKGSYIPIKDND